MNIYEYLAILFEGDMKDLQIYLNEMGEQGYRLAYIGETNPGYKILLEIEKQIFKATPLRTENEH